MLAVLDAGGIGRGGLQQFGKIGGAQPVGEFGKALAVGKDVVGVAL